MVIFLQFSLVDFRSLAGLSENLLTSPSWPSPFPHKEFVRGSGPIIPRNKRGINNWIGENFICNIKKGVRMSYPIILPETGIKLKNVSKHQFSSENYILTKYEFVFVSNLKNIELNYIKLQKVISCILLSKIDVRNENYKYTNTTFERISKSLKTLYLMTSSKTSKLDIQNQTKYIKECSPQLFFYLNSSEILKTNGKFIKPLCRENLYQFNLYGFWHNHNNKSLRIWIHQQRSKNNNNSFDRELRISFLRFHSEYESLKIIFKGISDNNIKISSSTQSDILQKYLNKAITTILKSEQNISYQDHEGIYDYLKNLFLQFQPGELDLLKDKINNLNFRPQIEQKTINFINNFIEKSDMNITQNISGSQVINQENSGAGTNTFNFQGIINDKELNLKELNDELMLLLSINKSENNDSIVTHNVEEMKKATDNNDPKTFLKHLENCGKWILDVGTKISVPLIVEIIKKHSIQ
ncbi:hypothetical protein EWM62_01885 [Mucilaginibacter terrigena]|uniref:Uncharacterized protein n=1 Tax=Mucilaginibacter terrigena TaxID=2492395 RepID=A0A4Q5LS69_9SPHI|nr:hypothetical protein [Mucilaginibacter terrigena]RYU92209.1 hypothetical protein EWM62_01885 [Mucilaginibacter terrigena]